MYERASSNADRADSVHITRRCWPPFLAKLPGYLLVGNRPSGFGVGLAALNGLQDVQMVLHIIQTAVVRQTVKKLLDALLDMHFHISRRRIFDSV